jgi:flagellar basal-body rod protein FlgB
MEDPSLLTLQKLLDTAALRHKVIANNLANVNTPGYQRREVRFGDHLARALAAGDTEALRTLRPQVVRSADPPLRADGSNVALERELADLMKNSLVYNTCTQLLASRLAAYRAAISGDSRT